ncbi:MAG: arginine repressor [Candidatus Limnocylindrales bacterium]
MARNNTSELLKKARQQAVADVVRDRRLRTQRELVAALKDKGFRVTQATVSRDVAEMGLVKVRIDGAQVYALPSAEEALELGGDQRLTQLLRDLPIEVRRSGTMLVIRAVPGSAHAIAAALDRAHWRDVLGTIAGDDTLFVACTDDRALARVKRRLLRLGR